MVTIRLSRSGVKKRPFYNIRVADSRRARDGAYLERVGYFNPGAKGQEKRLVLDMERVESWLSLGAQPSDRVKSLIKDYKLGDEVVAERRTAKLEKANKRKEIVRENARKEAMAATSADADDSGSGAAAE